MKFFKKTDLLIVSAILVVSLVFWGAYKLYFSQTPAIAEIYCDSKLVETVDLSKKEDRTFSIPQNEHVVFHLYSDGSIRFEKSSCRDKRCIRSGRLETVGERAACLPNRIVMKIVRKSKRSDGDLDIIIGN